MRLKSVLVLGLLLAALSQAPLLRAQPSSFKELAWAVIALANSTRPLAFPDPVADHLLLGALKAYEAGNYGEAVRLALMAQARYEVRLRPNATGLLVAYNRTLRFMERLGAASPDLAPYLEEVRSLIAKGLEALKSGDVKLAALNLARARHILGVLHGMMASKGHGLKGLAKALSKGQKGHRGGRAPPKARGSAYSIIIIRVSKPK